jgi:hypothetical protein
VAGDTRDDGGRPQRNLAVRPSSLAPVPTDTVPPSASASASAGASGGPSVPGASAGSSTGPGATARPSSAGTAAPEAPYHQVGSTTDLPSDAGATTPAYADAVAVTVEDNGANARITVTMRGDVPARLPGDETMGVGVDFYAARTDLESQYQVFADGEPDGWFAYYQGPRGRVRYPGTFGLGGRRLVFTVPWSVLGARASGYFSAFVDWARTASPANLSGEDHAPDLGYATYRR